MHSLCVGSSTILARPSTMETSRSEVAGLREMAGVDDDVELKRLAFAANIGPTSNADVARVLQRAVEAAEAAGQDVDRLLQLGQLKVGVSGPIAAAVSLSRPPLAKPLRKTAMDGYLESITSSLSPRTPTAPSPSSSTSTPTTTTGPSSTSSPSKPSTQTSTTKLPTVNRASLGFAVAQFVWMCVFSCVRVCVCVCFGAPARRDCV